MITIEELKTKVNEGYIRLVSPKRLSYMKKGWIKCYDLDDIDFDEVENFSILIFTEKNKYRGEICAEYTGMISSHESAIELLLRAINKDLEEGFTFLENNEK